MKHRIPLVLIVLFAAATSLAAQGPMAYLKSVDKKLQPLVKNAKKNQKKIVAIINDMIDFPDLCRRALGKHWDARTPEERTDFSSTLQALIEKNLTARLESTADGEVQYLTESVRGTTAEVTTVVRDGKGPRAQEIEIVYVMERRGKRWKVVDMRTDGMSLVANYRSQFNKLITEKGWDQMMAKMKKKLAE